jgi:hypothetical protein
VPSRTDKKRDEKAGKQKNRDAVNGVLHGDADGLTNDLCRGVFCRLRGLHVRRLERVHPIGELRLDVLRRHLVGVGLLDGRAERVYQKKHSHHLMYHEDPSKRIRYSPVVSSKPLC